MLKIEINATIEDTKVNGKKMISCKTNNKYSGEASLDELIAMGTMLDASLKPIFDIIKEKGGTDALKAFACGLNDSLMSMTEV